MACNLEFSVESDRDFDLIFDYLLDSYLNFGESMCCALERAGARVPEIRMDAERILTAPNRGARHDDILPGLGHLMIGRAIHWLEVDDRLRTARILAVFFDGQDHVRQMLVRLLEN